MFWHPLRAGVHYLAKGALPSLILPAWYLFLERVSPTDAYQVLVGAALDIETGAALFRARPAEAVTMPVAEQLGTTTVPFYLGDWSAGAVLALWVVVPTLLGYVRFHRSDL
jgi:hypothetical protein